MATLNPFDNGLSALKTVLIGLMLAVLAACTTTDTRPIQPVTPIPQPLPEQPETDAPDIDEVEETPDIIQRDGLTPPHMAGRDIKRVALLLPFSAQSERLRAEAASMLKAVEIAVFYKHNEDILLITLDTQGTSRGAKAAVQTAIKSGSDVIIGPILAGSVAAIREDARAAKIPVIAFSTDQRVAGNGTYLLSFPPEGEIRRIVDFARTNGMSRFAFLGPDSAYGRRVLSEYSLQVRASGGAITAQEVYSGRDIAVMDAPARRLAEQFRRVEEQTEGEGPMAFEALILPEGGTALRSLAPLLLYYEDGTSNVQFLGTSLWQREDTVREPALRGGIFAGPDLDTRQPFLNIYKQRFGEDPSQLASLAIDAIGIAADVTNGKPSEYRARLERPIGFYGVDGRVIFKPDGTADRGLAVYQIQNGQFIIIDPAPKNALGTN